MTTSTSEYDLVANQCALLLGCAGAIVSASLSLLGAADGITACTGAMASTTRAAQVTGYRKGWTRVLPVALLAVVALIVAVAGASVSILIAGQLRQEWYTLYRGSLHLLAGTVAGAGATAAGRLMRAATGGDVLKEMAAEGNPRIYATAIIVHATTAAFLVVASFVVATFIYVQF